MKNRMIFIILVLAIMLVILSCIKDPTGPPDNETTFEWCDIPAGDFTWGENISGDRANFWGSGDPWDNGTTPIGYYNGQNGTTDSPSAYGVYDMCGNVFNWTDSWHGSSRVLRGGYWNGDSTGTVLRSWYRNGYYPTVSYNYIGFRCARTL